MKETNEKQPVDLPENAFRELKPGEEYKPILSPDKVYPEVNAWSVSWGIVMAVIFSAAAAFLGLRVGQVFEAAIPIAIIAVGLSGAAKRKNALGENVIIQSIGACSGVIVAGAIFTLPALYILQAKYPELTVNFMEVFLSSLLGGILGILFLIPFRKYFVSDMHGKYPFPEATATAQVLVSGEKAGNQAKPLILAGLVGGLYDFCLSTFGWWSETLTTRILPWGAELANNAKMVFKVNTGAAVLGLGYIVGLKYCLIICSGSLFVWFIIIPLLGSVPGSELAAVAPEQIFTNYGRYIGIVEGPARMDDKVTLGGYVELLSADVRSSDFDVDAMTVTTNSMVLPISDRVMCYNETTKEWFSVGDGKTDEDYVKALNLARAFSDSATIYYDKAPDQGGKVRIVEVK